MDHDEGTPSYPSSSEMIDQWRGRAVDPDVEAPASVPPVPPPAPPPEPPEPAAGDPFASEAPPLRPAVPEESAAPWETASTPQRPRRLPGIRALISIGVVLFVAVGAWMARGQKSVVDLEAGDCFDDPGVSAELIETVKTVDCAGPHDFEVFAVLTAPMDTYPGEAAMFEWADEACYAEFEAYTGVPYEQSPLFFTSMIPVADGWAEGDRGVDCVLGLSSNGWDITPIEGSQRGPGEI